MRVSNDPAVLPAGIQFREAVMMNLKRDIVYLGKKPVIAGNVFFGQFHSHANN